MTAPLASSAEGVEALAKAMHLARQVGIEALHGPQSRDDWDLIDPSSRSAWREAAAALIASGAVQDRREVAAETLEEAADDVKRIRVEGLREGEEYGPHDRFFEIWLRHRAHDLRATTSLTTQVRTSDGDDSSHRQEQNAHREAQVQDREEAEDSDQDQDQSNDQGDDSGVHE